MEDTAANEQYDTTYREGRICTNQISPQKRHCTINRGVPLGPSCRYMFDISTTLVPDCGCAHLETSSS